MGNVSLWISVRVQQEGTVFLLELDRETEGRVDPVIQARVVQATHRMFEEIWQIIRNHSHSSTPPPNRPPLTERLHRLANLMARHPDRADRIMDTVLEALRSHGLEFDPHEAAGAEFWERLAQSDPETQETIHRALDDAGKRIKEILSG